MSHWTRIGATIALHSLVLVVMVGLYAWTRATGEAIQLRTDYVSPRALAEEADPRLDLEISTISVAEVNGDKEFALFDTAYVTVQPGQGSWYADGIYRRRSAVPAGSKAIRGRITKIDARRPRAGASREPLPVLQVEFGIEDLDLDNDTLEWMRAIPNRREMMVTVLVDDAGHALRQGVRMGAQDVVSDRLF